MQPEDGVMLRGNSLRRILPVALPLISLVFGLLVPTVFFAQTRKPDEPKQGMGVSTGAALSYTSRRTVNITDPKAPVVFEDVTAGSVLANFRHRSGVPDKPYILDTAGAGV